MVNGHTYLPDVSNLQPQVYCSNLDSFFDYDNTTYPANYLFSTTSQICTQESSYSWGFTTEIVFLICISNFIWFLGIYVLWMDGERSSEMVRKGRRLGRNRAVIDIAEVLTARLGHDTAAYSEDDLIKALQTAEPVKYSVSPVIDPTVAHLGLSSVDRGRMIDRDRVKLEWEKLYGGAVDTWV